uniref:Uncharacterized protein n=1 Tax=Cacopsylla melanoneura TaxID=428564 RepID=A0A8D8WNB0_9HEMI
MKITRFDMKMLVSNRPEVSISCFYYYTFLFSHKDRFVFEKRALYFVLRHVSPLLTQLRLTTQNLTKISHLFIFLFFFSKKFLFLFSLSVRLAILTKVVSFLFFLRFCMNFQVFSIVFRSRCSFLP